MNGKAFVFINYWQAAHCGHLGWGFKLDESDRYLFGSTDHLLRTPYWDLVSLYKYMRVPPQSPTDWWAREGTLDEMLHDMQHGHHVQYEAFKVIDTAEAEPLSAQAAAEQTGTYGWAVLDNNCLHQTHSIIAAYGAGADLPDHSAPPMHRIPRFWFDKIAAQRHWLR